MQQTKTAHRTASRAVGALIICLWFASPVWSDADKDRKKAAKSLAKEIEQAQFHKVYVPDFLDLSGTRTEKGCFFASTFSTNLAKDARNFAVVNRIQAQKQLNELHVSTQDLQQPEMLSKVAQALSADAILVGSAAIHVKDVKLSLSLRDASGKEVHSLAYEEKLQPAFETSFPASEDLNTHAYYFPGLDDVSQPKCIYCPNPDYSDEARRNKFEGNVLMSVTIDEKGAVRNVRVVQDPGNGLAQQSVEILKKWRMEPSHGPDGSPVPIRVSIETTFRLLHERP